MKYTVYGFFEDGCDNLLYVGCTSKKLATRISSHMAEARNRLALWKGNESSMKRLANLKTWHTGLSPAELKIFMLAQHEEGFRSIQVVSIASFDNIECASELEDMLIKTVRPVCNAQSTATYRNRNHPQTKR